MNPHLKRRLVIVVLAALAIPLASASPSYAAPEDACLVHALDGSLIWTQDDPTPEVEAIAEKLRGIADADPTIFVGSGYCHDRQSLWVSGESLSNSPELAQLEAATPTPILRLEVGSSLSELLALQASTVRDLRDEAMSFSSSVSAYDGKVELSLPANEIPTARVGSDSRLRYLTAPDEGIGVSSYDRYSDYSPFIAGGYVTGGCSLGPRININGTHMMLTAGHCGSVSSYYSGSGNWIGGLYTTSYPGNADIYGDWLLISGGSYSPNVFNGAPTGSSSSIAGIALNFGGYTIGGKICSSGITTGQVCTWIVTRTNVVNNRASDDGVYVGPMLELRYDPNTSGNPNDCYQSGKNFPAGSVPSWVPPGISRKGDSGGANYHLTRSSPVGVTYDGVTTGQYIYQYGTQVRCLYYTSQLAGVKAYASSASW